jgi:hypothetical protein
VTSFDEIWNYLQSNLKPGAQIRNWTAFGGYLGDEMTVTRVSDEHVKVDAPSARNVQVVPKEDFKEVWEVWSGYKTLKVKRYELRDMTRYSKYIISILHWFETEN